MEQPTAPTYSVDDLVQLFRRIEIRLARIETAQAFNPCQEYLGVKDVAELLRVSEPTVRKFINEGKIKASKPGAHYIIPSSSIRDFLISCQVK